MNNLTVDGKYKENPKTKKATLKINISGDAFLVKSVHETIQQFILTLEKGLREKGLIK